MLKKIIAFPGRQIASIHELADENGKRKIGQVYFIDDPGIDYWLAYAVTEQTDHELLKQQIGKGIVYVISEL